MKKLNGTNIKQTFIDDSIPVNSSVIETGWIPVEYNYYKTLLEKAKRYDNIQAYISEMENKNADV